MKPTISSLVEEIQGKPGSARCLELATACTVLKNERSARLKEIAKRPAKTLQDQSKSYRELFAKGPQAVSQEREKILAELDHLEELGFAINHATETAKDSEAKAAAPRELKKLPGLFKTAEKALNELNRAVEAINESTNVIAEDTFRRPNQEIPFTDEEFSRMFKLRNDLWAPIHLNMVYGLDPDPYSSEAKRFPKTWPLIFELRGDLVREYRAPQKFAIDPSEYSSDPVLTARYAGKAQ